MSIRIGQVPVHNVSKVRLVEEIIPSSSHEGGQFVTVSVIVEDEDGTRENIATLYGGNGSKIDILV
jgi:hypothetical protein